MRHLPCDRGEDFGDTDEHIRAGLCGDMNVLAHY
jgi:hypothetical protein